MLSSEFSSLSIGSVTWAAPYRSRLEAKVSNCPQCQCVVTVDGTLGDQYELKFAAGNTEVGLVQVSDLRPHTAYTFTLTCRTGTGDSATSESAKKTITTDYSRPAAPTGVDVVLHESKKSVIWQSQDTVAIPIEEHQVTIDGKTMSGSNHRYFVLPDEYLNGNLHKITVRACRKNNQKVTICSPPSEQKEFQQVVTTTSTTTSSTVAPTTTTSTTTTTTPTSIAAPSFSLAVPVILGSFAFVLLAQW